MTWVTVRTIGAAKHPRAQPLRGRRSVTPLTSRIECEQGREDRPRSRGSRAINPMELYQNQVTREQGPFSLRMFHRTWGLTLIQHNIRAPSTLLDFPTRQRFVRELEAHRYDVVGISSIIVNVAKVSEMCRLVREHSPGSRIVVGGHVAATPGIETMVDADFVVKGDGVR